MKRIFALTLLAASFTGPAEAKIMRPDIVKEAEFKACMKKAKGDLAAMVRCKLQSLRTYEVTRATKATK